MYNTPIERKISMDIKILLFIQENIRHYILTPFFTLITNEYFLYILLGIVLIYMFKKNEDTRRLAKETIIAFLICTVLFVVLKLIFQRPRPFDAFNELIPLVDKPSDYSFPSGHTASAFICAFMVYDGLPKKYSILIFILAILVAFSRLYVGVHYPTDILAVIVLACIIFSVFASSPPVVNPDAAAVTQVWAYIGELVFNMLVLVGAVKMSDRIIREMMGL